MSSSGMRSMESNHRQIVILRCKLVIVGEDLSLLYQIIYGAQDHAS